MPTSCSGSIHPASVRRPFALATDRCLTILARRAGFLHLTPSGCLGLRPAVHRSHVGGRPRPAVIPSAEAPHEFPGRRLVVDVGHRTPDIVSAQPSTFLPLAAVALRTGPAFEVPPEASSGPSLGRARGCDRARPDSTGHTPSRGFPGPSAKLAPGRRPGPRGRPTADTGDSPGSAGPAIVEGDRPSCCSLAGVITPTGIVPTVRSRAESAESCGRRADVSSYPPPHGPRGSGRPLRIAVPKHVRAIQLAQGGAVRRPPCALLMESAGFDAVRPRKSPGRPRFSAARFDPLPRDGFLGPVPGCPPGPRQGRRQLRPGRGR